MKDLKEFAKRAIQEYQGWPWYKTVLSLAFENNVREGVEFMLKEGQSLERNIDVDELMSAVNEGQMTFVRAVLEKYQRRRQLYKEWQEMK
ncbi:MAG: hypothetical protein ABIG65_01875 [Patescibacteria group bacterium]